MKCRECGKKYEEHGYFDTTICGECQEFSVTKPVNGMDIAVSDVRTRLFTTPSGVVTTSRTDAVAETEEFNREQHKL